MSQCPACGLAVAGDGICVHHLNAQGDDWAVGNRIMCDFFHRKKLLPRLAQTERDDEFWSQAA